MTESKPLRSTVEAILRELSDYSPEKVQLAEKAVLDCISFIYEHGSEITDDDDKFNLSQALYEDILVQEVAVRAGGQEPEIRTAEDVRTNLAAPEEQRRDVSLGTLMAIAANEALLSAPEVSQPELGGSQDCVSPGTWRKALILATKFLQTGILVGGVGGTWNTVLQLGGPSGGSRIGAAIGAAAFTATVAPDLDAFLTALRASLIGIPEFEGEIGLIMESAKGLLGSLFGGGCVTGGYYLADFLNKLVSEGEKSPQWLFLGFFVGFCGLEATNAGGQALFGKKLVIRRPEHGPLGETLMTAVKAFLKKYLTLAVLLKGRLPYFVPFLAYPFYSASMVNAAKAPETAGVALASGIVIFVLSFKLTGEVGGKVHSKIRGPNDTQEE